jgi:hypothetical protein
MSSILFHQPMQEKRGSLLQCDLLALIKMRQDSRRIVPKPDRQTCRNTVEQGCKA